MNKRGVKYEYCSNALHWCQGSFQVRMPNSTHVFWNL